MIYTDTYVVIAILGIILIGIIWSAICEDEIPESKEVNIKEDDIHVESKIK